MSRSNYNKPFYVDVGTSIVAIRCASNHDVIVRYDHVRKPFTLDLAKDICNRMNSEAKVVGQTRNCDVGTAEEQAERFDEFCYNHRSREKGCGDCPLLEGGPCCELAWLQMPYGEGGAKC